MLLGIYSIHLKTMSTKTSAHKCIFIITKKLEATKVSSNRQMDKLTAICPYNEILFSNKEEQAVDSCKDKMNLKFILLSKRSNSEKTT